MSNSGTTSENFANIILCGFMGTGKSTIGRIVASRLGWQFVDTDQVIETRQGRTIREIFEGTGEDAFRQLETDLCKELATWTNHVVATGGGIVLRPENRDLLRQAGMVICLEASAEEIFRRLQHATNRPLLSSPDPQQRIRELLEARAEAYGSLPYHLNTAGCKPSDTANLVIRLWKSRSRKHP
ncbi:MAG: shikimate kinase [Anaerolineae bacterium]|nr:shikimate kinase [Anaerolineae bacterium]